MEGRNPDIDERRDAVGRYIAAVPCMLVFDPVEVAGRDQPCTYSFQSVMAQMTCFFWMRPTRSSASRRYRAAAISFSFSLNREFFSGRSGSRGRTLPEGSREGLRSGTGASTAGCQIQCDLPRRRLSRRMRYALSAYKTEIKGKEIIL